MQPIFLLGPQRFDPTVATVLRECRPEGPVAVVTAGWQEREQEVDELREHLKREIVNLRLYERSEKILSNDTELADALQRKQRQLRDLQDLYRSRLEHAMESAREMMRLDGRKPLVFEHRQSAIRALRTLDRQHLTRIRRIHREFDEEWTPKSRSAVAEQVSEVEAELSRVGSLAIAGGHVAILLNRLRLFGLEARFRELPIFAWSAGAMVLTERVVLFHDRPPQGAGNSEVLDSGLGIAAGVLALPHATARLALEDPVRVSLMARRFRPDMTVLLDPGAIFERNEQGWRGRASAQTLTPRGAIVAVKK